MIGSTLLLLRRSLPSVIVLAAAVVCLVNLLSGDPEQAGAEPTTMPSLAPLSTLKGPAFAALARSALFDPDRRAETISGSIADLRPAAETTAAPVTIAGVLLSGRARKAMLSVGGAAPAWNGVGAELGGWRVAAIDAEGAVIERDGQSVTLRVADRYKTRGRTSADPAQPGPETGQTGPDAAPATPVPPPEPDNGSLPPMP